MVISGLETFRKSNTAEQTFAHGAPGWKRKFAGMGVTKLPRLEGRKIL